MQPLDVPLRKQVYLVALTPGGIDHTLTPKKLSYGSLIPWCVDSTLIDEIMVAPSSCIRISAIRSSIPSAGMLIGTSSWIIIFCTYYFQPLISNARPKA